MLYAASGHDAELFVCQSLLGIYGDRAGTWVDESVPVAAEPGRILQSAVDMEAMVKEAGEQDGLPTVRLRFGMFYAADSALTRGMLAALSQRQFPQIGDGTTYWNLIHADDAAAAVLAAVERPAQAAGHAFNLSDDEPVAMWQLLTYLAAELGAASPRAIPEFVARIALGGHLLDYLTASFRSRNDQAKRALGWNPTFPSYRQGYSQTIERWRSAGGG